MFKFPYMGTYIKELLWHEYGFENSSAIYVLCRGASGFGPETKRSTGLQEASTARWFDMRLMQEKKG